MHTHEFIELVYIISGNMIQCMDGEFVKLNAGGLIYLRPGCTHSYVTDEDVRFVNIFVRPEWLDTEVRQQSFYESIRKTETDAAVKPCVQFATEELSAPEHVVLAMLAEYHTQKKKSAQVMELLFCSLLRMFCRKIEEQQLCPILLHIREYVDLHCFEPLSLAEVAGHFGYNPSYFSRKFKHDYGIGWNAYVHRTRVRAAALLLQNTDFTVEQAAKTVGYRDTKQVYTMFQRYLGRTPRSNKKDE